MLLLLSQYLENFYSGFNVFQYLTLRTILGILTSLFISLLLGPFLIRRLDAGKISQQVRTDGPESHFSKSGTPTMGGFLIILSILISVLCWCDLSNRFVWAVIFVILAFSLIGWFDDYCKVNQGHAKGLSALKKYLLQSVFGLMAVLFLYYTTSSVEETQMIAPFFKSFVVDLGPWYILLAYLVIVGSSNGVNLTDGLDGLAILPVVMIAGALAIFAYLTGHIRFADYLGIPYIFGVGEVAILCGAIVGAGLGFLWFNTYPAQVFMGDIGSLSLGAALGVIAVIVRQELAFFIMAGVFVVETLSVILQVASFKLIGKRLFRMAPLHHHFELKGWPEPRVIVRFWIITVILVLIGLSSLKIR